MKFILQKYGVTLYEMMIMIVMFKKISKNGLYYKIDSKLWGSAINDMALHLNI